MKTKVGDFIECLFNVYNEESETCNYEFEVLKITPKRITLRETQTDEIIVRKIRLHEEIDKNTGEIKYMYHYLNFKYDCYYMCYIYHL